MLEEVTALLQGDTLLLEGALVEGVKRLLEGVTLLLKEAL